MQGGQSAQSGMDPVDSFGQSDDAGQSAGAEQGQAQGQQAQGPDILAEIDRIYELLGAGGQPQQPRGQFGADPYQPQQPFQPQYAPQPPQQPQGQQQGQPGQALPFMAGFEREMAKLKEIDGPVYEAVAPALRQTFDSMARHFQSQVQQAIAPFQEAHRTQVIKSANSAFDTAAKSSGLESIYGKDVRNATPAQRRTRDADFRIAAQLQQAAWAAGEDMDDGDALQKAIMLRQHRMTPGQAQSQMASQMRSRQASRTPPPGGNIPTRPMTPEQEEAAAIKYLREARGAV